MTGIGSCVWRSYDYADRIWSVGELIKVGNLLHLLELMYILPTPTDSTRPLGTFTQPLNRLMSVLSTMLGRSRLRVVQVDPRHFKSLGAHLAEHGIATQVRHGELIAHLRFSRRSSDLFLVEFAEFMTNAAPTCKAEWLEFCLELGEGEP